MRLSRQISSQVAVSVVLMLLVLQDAQLLAVDLGQTVAVF